MLQYTYKPKKRKVWSKLYNIITGELETYHVIKSKPKHCVVENANKSKLTRFTIHKNVVNNGVWFSDKQKAVKRINYNNGGI